jgi:hypothetical protein
MTSSVAARQQCGGSLKRDVIVSDDIEHGVRRNL